MKSAQEDICSCGSKYIVNRKYKMCENCNYIRLHGKTKLDAVLERQMASESNTRKRSLSSSKPSKNTGKSKREAVLEKDKQTYLEVFNSKPNFCEECGAQLPDVFEIDGQILAIFQYSHVLSKAAFPEFRNNPINFNRLCVNHHDQWEFGDRKSMSIFQNNQKIIATLLKTKNDE